MVRHSRSGFKFQIRKAYSDFFTGQIYHRRIIESRYWEDPTFVNSSTPVIRERKTTLVNKPGNCIKNRQIRVPSRSIEERPLPDLNESVPIDARTKVIN